MKKVFTMLVRVDEVERMEKVLNTFRIGLNERDKTRALDVQGIQLVNYTIVCEEAVFVSIVNLMNATWVYQQR